MRLSVEFAVFLSWFVLCEWMLVATPFAIDTWRVYFRSQAMYRTVQEINGLGLTDAARTRRQIQRWYIVASHLAVLIGIMALYRNILLPPLHPDTRIFTVFLQQLLIVFFFGLWRTERLLLLYYTRMDQAFENQQQEIEALKNGVEDSAAINDIQERVTEMQERGLEDRPAEQTDREEGHDHRQPRED